MKMDKLLPMAMHAVQNNTFERLQSILRNCAITKHINDLHDNIELDSDTLPFNPRKDRRISLLHEAARNGYHDIVQLLIDNKSDVNVRSVESSRTPLTYAVISGHLHIVKMLINANCDVNLACVFEVTPLHEACKSGSEECARILIQAGANVNAHDCGGVTPLMWLASWLTPVLNETRMKMMQLLIDYNCDINKCSYNEGTVLHGAVWNDSIVKFFIDAGADVNTPACSGESPIWTALEQGYSTSARLLVEYNCDVNISRTKDSFNQPLSRSVTNMEIAVSKFDFSSVHLLVWGGFKVTKELNNYLQSKLKSERHSHEMSIANQLTSLQTLLHDCANIPDRLDWQCRLNIRKHLGKQILDKATYLPIPGQLIKYVANIPINEKICSF